MVRILPIGGLGEFGANSMLIEDESSGRLIVDAGAAFADEAEFGVSYEVPDWSALGGPEPHAVLVSHAHDDHCKGLSSMLESVRPGAVAGSSGTLAWCRPALRARRVRCSELGAGAAVVAGGWQVDGTPVSHSIPGTLSVRMCSGTFTAVLASDLRLAPSALGETTSIEQLAAWGGEGVDVLWLDSTNALVDRAPPSETEVGTALAELVRGCAGLVVVVTFASHLGRFHQVVRAAMASGRVVVPIGRRLTESLAVQARLGGSPAPLGVVRPTSDLARLPRDSVVVVVTGTQGEPSAAFTRLATGRLPGLTLRPGDRVLHAARLIPGNERRLARLFDLCLRQGASVVTASDAPIHASGHAHQDELGQLLDVLRPRWVMPVHGWRRHLNAVAELARRHGARAVVAENGEELEWSRGELDLCGRRLPLGRVSFGGPDEGLIEAGVLGERRVLARGGVLVVALSIGETRMPAVSMRCSGFGMTTQEMEELEEGLAAEANRVRASLVTDLDDVRRTMERWLRRELRRRRAVRPVVIVNVLRPEPRDAAKASTS